MNHSTAGVARPHPSVSTIEAHLSRLEPEARRLEPGRAERRTLEGPVWAYADQFLERLDQLPAYVETEDKGRGLLNLPVREEGRPIEVLLASLASDVDRPGLNPASGGHLAYIPGGGVYPASLGDYLADVTNRYSGLFYASPGAVRMENLLVRWMASVVGYPDRAHGDLTSGGSMANLSAVVTARDAKGIRAADVPRSVIYRTDQVHHCVAKAVRIAGLGEAVVRTIPVDDRFRMRADALRDQVATDLRGGLRPFLVVASAGTTDTGAVDPLEDLAAVAAQADLWLHVDGAYGGFFLLCPEGREVIRGLARADSVVLDPHKGLFLPYGTGALLVRDADALRRSHVYRANYMQDSFHAVEEHSPADHSAELTRPFRGLRLWLPLQLFGLAPFRAALSEKIWLARYFHERVREIPGMVVGPDPQLSVTIFRWAGPKADTVNARLVEAVRRDGRVFLSSTLIDGVFWIRLAVLSFRTHRSTVDTALEVLRSAVGREVG